MFAKKIICLLLFLVVLLSCTSNKEQPLTIATAANMQYAVTDLCQSFFEETGIACQTIVSSSGKLTAQIKEGAPFDIFISADTKYPNDLYSNGFTSNTPKIYAYGKLILWTLHDTITPSIKKLSSPTVRHIASANPKTAPYGLITEQVLQYYNLLDSLKPKMVYGESIAQTNQFITSKAAELGFTAKSVIFTPGLKKKGNYIEVDSAAYKPIAQSAVILKSNAQNIPQSEKFFNFLFSKKGQIILKKHGYTTILNE
jgi:molybdate transport system substrate-binding protein